MRTPKRLARRHRRRRGPDRIRDYTAVIERCPRTRLLVGWIPGFAGAHSQGATLDELMRNLHEVVAMLLADGEPRIETEFVGTQNLRIG
jgi:predicted RNase H-like HicB family nuclease